MLISALTFTGVTFAQEQTPEEQLNTALELANQGNDAFAADSPELALEAFQASLNMVEGLEVEGADSHAETCKTAICNIYLVLAKNVYRSKQWDAAVTAFEKAKEVAAGYGNQDVVAEAETLIISSKANALKDKATEAKQNKDYATAAGFYKQMVDMDPDNGAYLFQLGDAYYRMKDWDNAVLYLEQAKANGQEKNALKLLSSMFSRRSQMSLKSKNYQEAIDFALKANEYQPSAGAFKTAGDAAAAMGKTEASIEHYTKGLEVADSKTKSALIYSLGAAYANTGNKAKATELFQQIANDPRYGANARANLQLLK